MNRLLIPDSFASPAMFIAGFERIVRSWVMSIIAFKSSKDSTAFPFSFFFAEVVNFYGLRIAVRINGVGEHLSVYLYFVSVRSHFSDVV